MLLARADRRARRCRRLVSPASLARPGENVWSPNAPLVTASEIRSAFVPKPYPDAAGKAETFATAAS